MTQVLKITIYAATIVTTIGFLMGMFIPQLAVSIFTTHEELVNISAKGLRIVVMFFPIVGFQMVTSNFFQSIGMASKAIFLSISRQVLVLIPCLLILPRFYGQLGVWISMPIFDSQSDCRRDALVAVPSVQKGNCLICLFRYSFGETPTYCLKYLPKKD